MVGWAKVKESLQDYLSSTADSGPCAGLVTAAGERRGRLAPGHRSPRPKRDGIGDPEAYRYILESQLERLDALSEDALLSAEGEGPPPAREFVLLRYFLEHPGKILSRERLLKDVWGYPRVPESRTVDVHVARLRERLEADRARPRHFLTLRGRGYRFVPDER